MEISWDTNYNLGEWPNQSEHPPVIKRGWEIPELNGDLQMGK
jgi:hypothetical protein